MTQRKGDAVQMLEIDMMAAGIPFVREFQFAPPRRWRFDFAMPERKIAIEVDGGVYSGGRHTTGKGFEADLEKLNRATTLGWRVLRYSTGMVQRGVLADIEAVLGVLR